MHQYISAYKGRNKLYSRSCDGAVLVWDTDTYQHIDSPVGHTGYVLLWLETSCIMDGKVVSEESDE